jgi:hypothetical protein
VYYSQLFRSAQHPNRLAIAHSGGVEAERSCECYTEVPVSRIPRPDVVKSHHVSAKMRAYG